jgi:hypothetical protein
MNTRWITVYSGKEWEETMIALLKDGYRQSNIYGRRVHFWKGQKHTVVDCRFWKE